MPRHLLARRPRLTSPSPSISPAREHARRVHADAGQALRAPGAVHRGHVQAARQAREGGRDPVWGAGARHARQHQRDARPADERPPRYRRGNATRGERLERGGCGRAHAASSLRGVLRAATQLPGLAARGARAAGRARRRRRAPRRRAPRDGAGARDRAHRRGGYRAGDVPRGRWGWLPVARPRDAEEVQGDEGADDGGAARRAKGAGARLGVARLAARREQAGRGPRV